MARDWGYFPCGKSFCPLDPPPDLSLIPDEDVVKLPRQEPPRKKWQARNRGEILNILPRDVDGWRYGATGEGLSMLGCEDMVTHFEQDPGLLLQRLAWGHFSG